MSVNSQTTTPVYKAGMVIGTDSEPYAPMMKGRVLISGCPRSGTRAVSKYYNSRGLHLGHEQPGKDGSIDWRHAYNLDLDFPLIMTIVRDPIKTVISLTELIDNSYGDNLTRAYIERLAKQGHWEDLLIHKDSVGAAIMWWTSVYEARYGFPTIHTDQFIRVPHDNKHIKDARPFIPSINTDRFFEVAARYGYQY